MKALLFITAPAVALVALFAFYAAPAEAKNVGKAGSPTLSVNASGTALVRGAEVTKVEGDTITALTSWDSVSLTWTIETDGGTEFVGNGNGKDDLSGIEEGDEISFLGELSGAFRVEADIVREWPSKDHDKNADGKPGHGPWTEFWGKMKERFGR